jgi:hypothetical protein
MTEACFCGSLGPDWAREDECSVVLVGTDIQNRQNGSWWVTRCHSETLSNGNERLEATLGCASDKNLADRSLEDSSIGDIDNPVDRSAEVLRPCEFGFVYSTETSLMNFGISKGSSHTAVVRCIYYSRFVPLALYFKL